MIFETESNSALKVIYKEGKPYVLDLLRKKYVRLFPEEFVRQQVLHWLINEMNCPAALIKIEGKLVEGQRADILVYDRQTKPWLLIECKAENVKLGEGSHLQVGKYNSETRAPWVMLTNLNESRYFAFSKEEGLYQQVTGLPDFPM